MPVAGSIFVVPFAALVAMVNDAGFMVLLLSLSLASTSICTVVSSSTVAMSATTFGGKLETLKRHVLLSLMPANALPALSLKVWVSIST